jgi:hypothetical protein
MPMTMQMKRQHHIDAIETWVRLMLGYDDAMYSLHKLSNHDLARLVKAIEASK